MLSQFSKLIWGAASSEIATLLPLQQSLLKSSPPHNRGKCNIDYMDNIIDTFFYTLNVINIITVFTILEDHVIGLSTFTIMAGLGGSLKY